MAESRSQPRDRTIAFSLAAAALVAAMVIVYLLLVNSQTQEQWPDAPNKLQVAFTASFIGLMAVLSLSGAAAAKRGNGISQTLLLAAMTGNLALGILGILSIGAPLFVAGALLLAIKPFGAHPLRNLLPPALVLIVLSLGTALTNQAH